MAEAEYSQFRQMLRRYYQVHGRHDLPWRKSEASGYFDPYKILVSELMLQQTQVIRVIPKFQDFITRFPSVETLAQASLGEVLIAWSGLGYNRRAKFLWQAAQIIMHDYAGIFPQTSQGLVQLPGVGPNTAGAILAYAFNQPAIFVETNIRTVYIHYFFHDKKDVSDLSIAAYVTKTLDNTNPREFYWMLMDYGTYLKQTLGNLNVASKHYTKQSKFIGSRRQVRGAVLRTLITKSLWESELTDLIADDRLAGILQDLLREGLITKTNGKYGLH